MRILRNLIVLVIVGVTPAVAATATATLQPQAAGTVTFFPNFDLLFVQSNGDISSLCFNTTGDNLQFRRGFVEFAIPVSPKRVVKATLTITETRGGQSSTPRPPDVHELSSYPADLVVGTQDYDAPAVLIGTFETDANDPPDLRKITFDVTEAVRQSRKSEIGFRIKLQIDPAGPCVDFAGSEFGGLFFEPPSLEIEFRGVGYHD
jgi:hypothetical protein